MQVLRDVGMSSDIDEEDEQEQVSAAIISAKVHKQATLLLRVLQQMLRNDLVI